MTQSALMNTYGRMDIRFVRGEGVWLVAENGQRYLDAISGIGVCNLGHAHPAVTRTIQEQAANLLHTSNLYRITAQEDAGDALLRVSGMDRVFFCNSGAEANEAAIKLARLHGHQSGIDNPAIVVLEKAFHGRTMATLTASGNRKIQAGFEPLVSGFIRAPVNDLDALQAIARNNPKVVAVLVEPVQGEGGVNPLTPEYIQGLRQICDNHNWLMMLDEVQTGNGRTGKYFAYQHHAFMPDVVTTAKGLGNGVPIGACLARGKAATVFAPGNHGSTFGGNPLVCATALTVINTIDQEQLPAQAAARGQYMQDQFRNRLANNPKVTTVRGLGLMLGIELKQDCGQLVGKALERNLLINVTDAKVIRLLPPLIISEQEADIIINTVVELIEQL